MVTDHHDEHEAGEQGQPVAEHGRNTEDEKSPTELARAAALAALDRAQRAQAWRDIGA